jgi:sporulation protein YlmC with PRC-barrel domain
VSARELRVTRLLGRRVRDVDGRVIGRIEELICEIELHERGRDYVVRELCVGTLGALERIGGSRVARLLVRTLLRGATYTHHRIPWHWMDLSDPARPRLNRAAHELRRETD